uniref:acetate--CoA ligase n=1 Tax=Ditylenchus dipsaci TaxID=166011 RepID=A0A915CY83_9BILA
MMNFESGDERLKKCCPCWTIEKSALLIGFLGGLCTFSELVFHFDQINVTATILGFLSYLAIVIAVLKKMPYLFFSFLVYNLFEIMFYVPAFFYLLFAIVSRDEKIQLKACLFLERLVGSELELNKQAPYTETVLYAILVLGLCCWDHTEMSITSKKVLDALTGSSTSLRSFKTSIITTSTHLTSSVISVAEEIEVTSPNHNSQNYSSPPPPVCTDTPNEYRNLLTSLSGQKSDHVQWIECLKQFNWKGDSSEFSFSLDKCGVPSLKNGNYQMNLCFDCLDLVLEKQQENESSHKRNAYKFLWEGNYYDGGKTSDHAQLTMQSISVVVNKCANILRQNPGSSNLNDDHSGSAKGKSVLVYMPNVVQLLVSVLAVAKVGAVLTFVNAAVNQKAEELARILELSAAELVITVDGFFMGEELHCTKKVLDEAIEILHASSESRVNRVFLVRHTGSNPGIPPPTKIYNRRPFYGLEVPFTPERDQHWSNLMMEANEECECEWLDSQDIVFNTIKQVAGDSEVCSPRWHFESYNVGQIALLARMLSRTFENNRICSKKSIASVKSQVPRDELDCQAEPVIWPVVDMEDLLFLTTLFAVPLANYTLLLSESPPTHPNPSRIFQIIEKHGVRQLILAEQYTRLLIRNEQFENVWHQDSDPIWSTSSLEAVYTASKSRMENEKYIEWLSKCAPSANIMHLSC